MMNVSTSLEHRVVYSRSQNNNQHLLAFALAVFVVFWFGFVSRFSDVQVQVQSGQRLVKSLNSSHHQYYYYHYYFY
jgi:hypothetical protein